MSKLEKTIQLLNNIESGKEGQEIKIDPRCLLLTILIFLVVMLSVNIEHIDVLLWFMLFPIIMAPILHLSYSRIFLQSLIVLPLVLLIGMFNPMIDRSPAFYVGNFMITNGWLSFIGIVLRGLLSMQVLLLLINSVGFNGLVRCLRKIGVPKFLTTQLLMVFRYIKVLLEEADVMRNAIMARSFGRKNLSLRMWGILIGQLFIRSVDRAERIHNAMLARGFNGTMPDYDLNSWNWSITDTFFIMIWAIVFLFLRIYNLSLLFV